MIVCSCDLEETNIDPNRLTEEVIPIESMLPATQAELGKLLGGRQVKISASLMGQITYQQGPTGYNEYGYTPSDGAVIGLWDRYYVNVMNSASNLKKKALEENNTYYAALADILTANALGNATSIFGDIPFSESFKSEEITDPAFEDQQQLYNQVQLLLDNSISTLSSITGGNPGSDDIFFRGNTQNWIKYAYALKARYYMHLIKRDVSNYSNAENALDNAFTSNSDNCIITFTGNSADEQAPMYIERTGTRETTINLEFAKLLNDNNDPRAPFYAIITSSILSGIRAVYGPYYTEINSPFPIITYEECLFLRSEIAMQKSDTASAASFLNQAIKASLDRVTSASISYDNLGTPATLQPVEESVKVNYANEKSNFAGLTTDEMYNRIFEEKYIALFLQHEPWVDYRRTENYTSFTGLPNITPATDQGVPRRMYYSSIELGFNSSAPTLEGLYDRMWWDE